MKLIEKLRYMARQYTAGEAARGGVPRGKHYLDEAADTLESNAAELDQLRARCEAGWISADTPPEDGAEVVALIYPYNNRENRLIAVHAHYMHGEWLDHEGETLHPPTHWARMPSIAALQTQADEAQEQKHG